MKTYEAIRPVLLTRVVPAYAALGGLGLAYALGSLVEDLATQADLDLVLVWDGLVPEMTVRMELSVGEATPSPEWFDEPGFVLDRFWVSGQQIDAKHVTAAEFRGWIDQVGAGGGTSGYPMPLIAVAGFLSGDVLHDPHDQVPELLSRLQRVPEALTRAISGSVSREVVDQALAELEGCLQRGDGLLFYSIATELMRRAYIWFFARQDRYWPHEKRLQTRLGSLGRVDLAEGDRAIWTGPLSESLVAIRIQLGRLQL